jgi:hypothetical protein
MTREEECAATSSPGEFQALLKRWQDEDAARDAAQNPKPVRNERPAKPATLSCSFCRKSQHEVWKLIQGPSGSICDTCVASCTDILEEQQRPRIRVRCWHGGDRISRLVDQRTALQLRVLTPGLSNRDRSLIEGEIMVLQGRIEAEMAA